MALVEVLLALLTVGVTIVITLVGWLGKMLLDLDTKTQSIAAVLFGNQEDTTDDGLVREFEEVHEKLDKHAEERREEHKQVETRLSRLQHRVDSIVNGINGSDKVDIEVDASHKSKEDD